ncbi:unnamed protein product [Rotaria sp. Silwood1]|nr:unnamed protein product [Rotaria sp. Silwood1]CAF1620954.1 unnamed protein product [Rotaria sp. Silwood1]CAF3750149.1 unnamed protein product [Rotaria sp. Silwood1]CAF3798204.1 unnamed protein product [Rotaria sp. Silwood1]
MNEDNRKGPFVIEPKYDCPHLGDRAYVLVQSTELADGQQPPCADCGKTEENWACLHDNCQYIGCSRYHQKHMLNHHETTGHNICLSLSDHSVFCYACDSYIDSPQLHTLNRQLSRTSH